MLIVMNMESGQVIRDPVASETGSCIVPSAAQAPLALLIPQPQLQEVGSPLRAACPPPSLGVINVSLSAFDA